MNLLAEISTSNNNRFKIVKGFIGAFRLMHFLPVITVTTMGAITAILSLKGESTFSEFFQNISNGTIEIVPFIFLVLVVFFQSAFLGIQNDYIDREFDIKYGKSKAIADGWVSEKFALGLAIAFYILFTGFSIGLGFWSVTGFWGILYVQGSNLIGMSYNILAKHRPYSIVPHMIGQPLIPVYAWLTFGGFQLKYIWIVPILFFIAFPAHMANEIPDFDFDIQFGNRNFAVFLGKKLATIVYWIAIAIIEVILVVIFFLYSLNLWVFIGIISLSILIAGVAIFLLWKREWNTDIQIFNVVTACLGVQAIGFFILFLI